MRRILNRRREPVDPILFWNEVALEADRTTHTTRAPSEVEVQGPVGSSRALAIVHLAMHDAYFSINEKYEPYMDGLPTPAPGADVDSAGVLTPRAPVDVVSPA